MSLKKTAAVAKPHAIFENNAGWTWKILKTYKTPTSERADPYARWFCAVTSPMTHGGMDMGDTYVRDVLGNARLVAATREYGDAYGINPAMYQELTE